MGGSRLPNRSEVWAGAGHGAEPHPQPPLTINYQSWARASLAPIWYAIVVVWLGAITLQAVGQQRQILHALATAHAAESDQLRKEMDDRIPFFVASGEAQGISEARSRALLAPAKGEN